MDDSFRHVVASGRGARVAYRIGRPDACYPGSPYAYHYLIEAMIRCGMNDEARRRLTEYWGGMAALGADTFWEVYDPTDQFQVALQLLPGQQLLPCMELYAGVLHQ